MSDFSAVKKTVSTLLGAALVFALTIPAVAAGDDADLLVQSPVRISLVYEPTHNPPRALGKGTAIDWQKPGLTLELLRLVEGRLGIEFTFKRVPWKRGLYLVEHNEVDGIFHASFKETREAIGVYPKKDGKPDQSRAIFFQSYVLYKLKGSPLGFDGENVINADGAIGAVIDYAIAGDLRKKGNKVEEAKTLQINFDKLANGRIVAFAMLENMADAYLDKNRDKYPNIVKVLPPLKSKAYYLLLSHKLVEKNPDLAERIWVTIAEIKASDAFKAIIADY